MSTLKTLTYHTTGRIARITLNRPERGNGITLDMPVEIAACVERANLDPEVHVIALSGNGKGFCGGYDLIASAELRMAPDDDLTERAPAKGEGGGEPSEASTNESESGSPIDPSVIYKNHDPNATWDPMVD